MSLPHDTPEFVCDTFNDFGSWEIPRRQRKDSFVDLMPPDPWYTDSIPYIDPGEAATKNDECTLQRFIVNFTPDLTEASSADTIELPKKRKKVKKLVIAPDSPKNIPIPIKAKQVGPITIEERKKKIERYLEKRRKRSWGKKICYDCRKRVADHRLRVKGRFVTKEQAILLLGIDHESVQKLLRMDNAEG